MQYHFPAQASVNRPVPKNRIYEHGKVAKAQREKIINQIEQIVWSYKLAPETINLTATQSVPELQIFDLRLKTPEVDEQVLRTIDRAIPFPIIYRLRHNGRTRLVAALKRPNEADESKWVLGDYLSSEWALEEDETQPLPQALDLLGLYHQLLRNLVPEPARPGESLADQLERWQQLRAARKELKKLETRLQQEKQFNRKVAINAELRELQQQIDQLSHQHT